MVFSVSLPCYEPAPLYMALVLCASLSLADEPYCAVRYRRLCQGKGRHVACQFPTPGPGPSCQNYTQIKFTSELKRFITNYINRRRQRIAAGHERVRGGLHLPRPQIMMFVEWDRELAYLAQRLADQCLFVHDDCRATVRYPYAGQTVGEVRLRRLTDDDELSASRAVRRVFDAWWGERRRVDPKQLTQPFQITSKGSVWGHFSQLAAWSLRAAGCGAVRHGYAHPRLLLVCDFSHTNMLGQRTLHPGQLAPCPHHTLRRPHSQYPLLCASSLPKVRNEQVKQTTEEYLYDEDDEFDSDFTTTMGSLYVRSEGRRLEGRKRILVEERFLSSTGSLEAEEITEDLGNIKESDLYDKLAGTLTKQPMVESRRKSMTKIVEKGSWAYATQNQSSRTGEGHAIKALKGKVHKNLEVIPLRTKIANEELEIFDKLHPELSKAAENFHYLQETTSGQCNNYDHKRKDTKNNIDSPQETRPTRPNDELLKRRHKSNWKQNRERPQRPGAAALLYIKNPVVPTETRPPPSTSSQTPFLMDDEVVHQVFKDTGFYPNIRKTKT